MSDWIELRRFVDPIEAEITRDFLRDHGVRVAMRGDAGGVVSLTHLGVLGAVRLLVPEGDRERAEEAMAAMHAPADEDEQPHGAVATTYRHADVDEDDGRFRARRFPFAAPVLSVLFPFGGGHFYAHHVATGVALAAGIVCALASSSSHPWTLRAALLMIVADAGFSVGAVRAWNERRPASEAAQLARGGAIVLASFLLAALTHRLA